MRDADSDFFAELGLAAMLSGTVLPRHEQVGERIDGFLLLRFEAKPQLIRVGLKHETYAATLSAP